MILIILGITDFRALLSVPVRAIKTFTKRQKIDAFFLNFFQHNIYFSLIKTYNGEIKRINIITLQRIKITLYTIRHLGI